MKVSNSIFCDIDIFFFFIERLRYTLFIYCSHPTVIQIFNCDSQIDPFMYGFKNVESPKNCVDGALNTINPPPPGNPGYTYKQTNNPFGRKTDDTNDFPQPKTDPDPVSPLTNTVRKTN